MRTIFISYRRDDAEGQAGRLYDDLTKQFGDDAVFMDVAAIEPGRDFRRVIDEQVGSCGVLLTIIGKNWLTAKNESGARRLDDPMDFVRLETASALKRDIPVVPVLVHAAGMPRAEDLPDDLKEISFRNGVELTHARWESDVQVLVKALRPYVQAKQEPASSDSPPASSGPGLIGTRPRRTLGAIVVGVLVLGVGGYAWYQKSAEPVRPVEPVRPAEPVRPNATRNILSFRDWEGSWDLQWEYEGQWYGKPMKLSADRLGIAGDYVLGTLKGSFVGGEISKVTGEIKNVTGTGTTCRSGEQGGQFSLALSSDGKSLDGWWDVCGEGKKYKWNAVKRS
jgi:TIR domain